MACILESLRMGTSVWNTLKKIKILNQAKKDFKDIIFMSFEQKKSKEIAKELNIKHRTTIVVYKGKNEVSRLIGQTSKQIIYSAIKEGI